MFSKQQSLDLPGLKKLSKKGSSALPLLKMHLTHKELLPEPNTHLQSPLFPDFCFSSMPAAGNDPVRVPQVQLVSKSDPQIGEASLQLCTDTKTCIASL